jgi:hypothetical protein
MNDLISSSLQMTSLEIAELVEKRHDNVKRTIEALAEREVIELPQIEEIPTATKPTTVYIFSGEKGKRDSIVVVAQLSPEFTARLVDRWQALESGDATPAFQARPKTKQPLRPREIREAFSCCMAIAKLCGLKGNQAALSADIGTRTLTGVSALALTGLTHLTADPRGRTYTPTDLGKMMVEPLSSQKTNKLLEEKGMQVHDIKGEWTPTDKAKNHCEWMDTNKRRSDGTPVKQLKWFASVLDAVGVEHRQVGEDAA